MVRARALALAHARSGIAVQLSGYMGRSEAFDDALAKFSVAYADQNERDHAALTRAIRAGRSKRSLKTRAEKQQQKIRSMFSSQFASDSDEN